jgi:thioredoxin reductase (NADPH)
METYDVIIIGGGPAGLACALYAARYNLKTLMISKNPGGAMTNAPSIENYPGFEKITGSDLAEKIINQIKKYKIEILEQNVSEIEKTSDKFIITTDEDEKFESKTILFSTGTIRRKLNIPGEKEFFGRGVVYCSTCDGPLFKDKVVAVAGGGDAGLVTANYLSSICKKVYIIELANELKAEPKWQDRIKEKENIEILTGTKIKEILGDQVIENLVIENSGGEKKLPVEGLFIEIGAMPNSELGKIMGLKLDEHGHIVINTASETSQIGVYAAGDVSTGSDNFWQILPAMAEGAIAAHSIYKFLK